jgi:hypothetical protein
LVFWIPHYVRNDIHSIYKSERNLVLRVVLITVIPTKVGIQKQYWQWIPASAGMTK